MLMTSEYLPFIESARKSKASFTARTLRRTEITWTIPSPLNALRRIRKNVRKVSKYGNGPLYRGYADSVALERRRKRRIKKINMKVQEGINNRSRREKMWHDCHSFADQSAHGVAFKEQNKALTADAEET